MINSISSNLKRAPVLALLCVIVLNLGGCAHSFSDSAKNNVHYINDQQSAFPEVLPLILPAYTAAPRTLPRVFDYLKQGAVIEVMEAEAYSALETGLAKYWYPLHSATVIIAVDRDRTDAVIDTWSDLPAANEEVGYLDGPHPTNAMLLSAISYALKGEDFTYHVAAKLLRELRAADRLIINSFDPPIMICYDYQAVEMIKSGLNIEIIMPGEGTMTYKKGLVSNTELVFSDDVDDVLIANGFRLVDGRCDDELYPDALAYESAAVVSDYAHFNSVREDATVIFRREVLHTRMYSSADGREHQYWVLTYLIIMAIWVASLCNRIAHKNMRNTALMAGLLLLGWMLARLISYQLDINTDLRRYIGYSYYLFQLLLPVVFMWMAYIIGKGEGKISVPLWFKAFGACMIALIVIVYTNDLHYFVYVYDFSLPNWGPAYSYGFVYSVIERSWQLSIAAVLVIMMFKSRGSIRKMGIIFPLLAIALLIAYQYGYQNNIPIARESDKTMVIGVLMILYAESLIRAGMIPVNTKYKTLFKHSTLGMRIDDNSGNTAWASASEAGSYPQPVEQDENTLLFSAPIVGGRTIWHEDISNLNRLHKEIGESVTKLKAANDLLAEEEKIKRAAQEEIAKTQLLTQLENEITGCMAKLSDMVEKRNVNVGHKESVQAALMLCYIKRRCNLFFLERESETLKTEELTVYLDEILEIADYAGVKIIITSLLKTPLPVRRATLYYDFFYCVIDWAVNHGCAHMLARLEIEQGSVIMRLFPSEDVDSFELEKELETSIASAGGEFIIKDLDDAYSLSLAFPEGGAENG